MLLYVNYCRYLIGSETNTDRVVLIHTICNALEFVAELIIIAIFYEKTKRPSNTPQPELKSESSEAFFQ